MKHFLSEDERIELEINTKKPEGGDYVLGEGDAVDLAPHVSKRLSSSQLTLDSPPPRQGQVPSRTSPSQMGTAKRKIESPQGWQSQKWARSESSSSTGGRTAPKGGADQGAKGGSESSDYLQRYDDRGHWASHTSLSLRPFSAQPRQPPKVGKGKF